MDEEAFQSTLKYIFTFIEKVSRLAFCRFSLPHSYFQEKQAESIVEKLCQRFRLSEDPRQWRDISYCLSLLPFKSERSVKKLIEGLQYYRDKLHEPIVFERFTEILAKVRWPGNHNPSLFIDFRHRPDRTNLKINPILSSTNSKRWVALRNTGILLNGNRPDFGRA